jgi:hypothetical protein
MHSWEILGDNRVNHIQEPDPGKIKKEIYVDMWQTKDGALQSALEIARKDLLLDVEIEQVEGMVCINLYGMPNDVILFHSRLTWEDGIHIATTKIR